MEALDFSDLSEEWVSQPRSSDPPVAKSENAPGDSIRSKRSAHSTRSASSLPKALREKPVSAINSRKSDPRSPHEILPEAFSGTMQHHEGAQLVAVKHATPEWRKRLLKANGKSQDLFSPIGLENVFRPPTVKIPMAAQSSKHEIHSRVLPSSPPLLPGHIQQSSFLGFDESMQLPPMRATSQTGPRRGTRTRNASGVSSNKSAARHEAFSPASLTVEEQKLSQIQSQSRSISVGGHNRPPSSMSDSVLYAPSERIQEEADSISLPEYSDLDSEQLNLNARIINTKRGGFSHDGSFRVRPLTPSSYQPPAGSSMSPLHESRLLTPSKKSNLDTSGRKASPQQKSSGSPLKLFHQYDTFTNDRLSRRISQFEAVKSSDPLDEQESIPTPSPRKDHALRGKQRMSSFGDGQLDQFDFTHTSEKGHTPIWPGSGHKEVDSGSLEAEGINQIYNQNDLSLDTDISIAERQDSSGMQEVAETDSEPKRSLDVSHKIPDPKRRRMSGKDGSSDEDTNLPRSRPLVKPTSFIAGKKRKDARRGEHNGPADAQVLAERQILDPVSPFRKLSRAFQKLVVDNEAQYIDVNMATDVLADELASLAINVAEDVVQGVRKKSVTTADFFREANLIMQHIRTRAAQGIRTTSTSIQAIDPPRQPSGRMSELFSNDDLDRPASREGDRRPRKRNPTLGTRMVSHLRKFADSDETGLALDSSSDVFRLQHLTEHQDVDSLESDRSDIRILDPPTRSAQELETGKINSISTTSTSIPTASSGTRNKATIEPHKVSHLIADTMGGMTFDHARQCWVKRRTSDPAAMAVSRLPSEMTEDDPFADIPDLIEHSMDIKLSKKQRIPSSSRPTTANTAFDNVLQSSGPVIGTRATSWSTAPPSRQTLTDQQRKREQAIEAALLREGRSAASQVSSDQPRAVTVCFSSPPVQSLHRPIEIEDMEDMEDVETPSKSGWNGTAEKIRTKNNLSSSMVRYAPRPLSRIDEMDNSTELSNATPASLLQQSLIKTPISRQIPVVPASNPSYISMRLTPLPDFTIHPADQSLNLDVQYVARKHGLKNHGEIEGQFSISIKNLVAKIADIEPYEPYWEQMKNLDLSKSALFTLHMLDEFCPRLEELNVNDGELGQLNGVPQALRILNVRNNCLSDLTAWHCLYNLQYLDVSGNKLTSLNAFTNLIHLRELKADSNQITSIDGIACLDGLLKLSLRHNSIAQVDVGNSKLHRLVHLDLSHNQITSVAGLKTLSALQRLNLFENKLETLNLHADHIYQKLEYLNVSTNSLTTLDVTSLPQLADLILDFNGIATIQGLRIHKSIQRVSWRYQKLDVASSASSSGLDYHCCIETRCLNLSGNRLLQFCPAERFLKLEKLDLASNGIKRLSDDFGNNLPNLRYLNLNHNALRELSGLVGLRRLSEIHLVNNRITSVRHAPQIMQNFKKTLEVLDLRNNPFNAGFYLVNKEKTMQLVVRGQQEDCPKEQDPFQDETFLMPDLNATKDAAYVDQIDHGTSMRRRVYELMLTRQCKKLSKLDGRSVEQLVVEDSDRIWKRLIDLGIVCSSSNPQE